MKILNFSHPLTEQQRTQIAERIGQELYASELSLDAIQLTQIAERIGQELSLVQSVPVQLDVEQDFAPQIGELVDGLGIESARWQNEAWLIVLPSLSFAAAVLLTELHARMGHFPTIIRLKPVQQNFTTQYEVAEIINLDYVRQEARKRRGS